MEIVDKHTDTEVLENCSKVLELFCNEDYAIAGKCNTTKSTLIDQLTAKFREAYQDFFQEVSIELYACINTVYPPHSLQATYRILTWVSEHCLQKLILEHQTWQNINILIEYANYLIWKTGIFSPLSYFSFE